MGGGKYQSSSNGGVHGRGGGEHGGGHDGGERRGAKEESPCERESGEKLITLGLTLCRVVCEQRRCNF